MLFLNAGYGHDPSAPMFNRRCLKFPTTVMKVVRIQWQCFFSRLAGGDPVQCWCLGAGPPRPQHLHYYKCQTGCESLFLDRLLCKETGTRSFSSPCLLTSNPFFLTGYCVRRQGLSPCLSESSPCVSQSYGSNRFGGDALNTRRQIPLKFAETFITVKPNKKTTQPLIQ